MASQISNALVCEELYCGYAKDSAVRETAASGGLVSAILIHLIKKGKVDAVIVSRIGTNGEKLCAISEWAQTYDNILLANGSSYVYVPLLKHLRSHAEYKRIAVVALPCQARHIRKWVEKSPNLRSRVVLTIGLFCRGAPTMRLYEDYLRKHGIDSKTVTSVRVSRSHLGGLLHFDLRGGQTLDTSFFGFNAYRTIGVHAFPKCIRCTEHLAEDADISVGDIYNVEYKQRSIKHSAFLPRTNRGISVLHSMLENDEITCEYFGIARYLREFRKLDAFTGRLKERRLSARIMGIPMSSANYNEIGFRPLHVLAWLIYLINYRISLKRWGRRLLFSLPAPAVRLMAIVFKLLSKI